MKLPTNHAASQGAVKGAASFVAALLVAAPLQVTTPSADAIVPALPDPPIYQQPAVLDRTEFLLADSGIFGAEGVHTNSPYVCVPTTLLSLQRSSPQGLPS